MGEPLALNANLGIVAITPGIGVGFQNKKSPAIDRQGLYLRDG
jgi:hypothetical protein